MDADHLRHMAPDLSPAKAHSGKVGILGLLGQVPYPDACDLQTRCRTERAAARIHDLLLLLEHPAVFTAGRMTRDEHAPGKQNRSRLVDIPLIRSDRGGSITYHGPGQLIGYPILKLSDYCAGPKAYVRGLETVLIRVLGAWNIDGHCRDGLPGVWIGGTRPMKIASIGVRIAHGITSHGFALNVSVDLEPFSSIVPCGIDDCRVTSMAQLLGSVPDPGIIAEQVAMEFGKQFNISWMDRVGLDRLPPAGEPAHSYGCEESSHA
ncbi:MAG TPA: lipoyl(octanoyl) transferase LipB [Nitrospiraceae bacterium]|nr:lipoyl(octanoyl) transferase LipB [Nitrospiraceae bacterium]